MRYTGKTSNFVLASKFFLLFLFSINLLAHSTQAQSPELLVVRIGNAIGGGPPLVTVVKGKTLFKINTAFAVSGSIQGELSERITQVFAESQGDDGLLPITTVFKIKTAKGVIEGYYSGFFNHRRDGSHFIEQRGEILIVPPAYIHLYRTEVFYQATLSSNHLILSKASLMIAPR